MSQPPTPVPPQPSRPQPAPHPQPEATPDQMGAGAVSYVSVWQHPFVQNMLPFITSLVLHAAVILVGLALYKTVESVIVAISQEQTIIPDATIIDGAEIGGIPHPGLGGDPNRDARQNIDENVPANSEGWATKASSNFTTQAMGGGSGDSGSRIGAAAGSGAGGGIGTGFGTGIGGGTGDGSGALAPFGVPGGGGGIGPKAPFVGMSGNATRIAYVCDASGSMMQKFDTLRVELRRAVGALKPIQAYNIYFFQNEGFVAADQRQLIMANAENKRRTDDFLLSVSSRGATDPIPGLKAAFDHGSQLIYLLTDGDFPDNDAVINFIRERNRDKKVKINTIAFLDRGEGYEKVLQTIARENGGMFRYVSERDLR